MIPKAASNKDEHSLDLDLDDEQNSVLNLALKRKFTELDDITKRLKARLIDVTDEADFSNLEDDFDAELNTFPDEGDVDDDFDWLEAVTGQHHASAHESREEENAMSMVGEAENKTDDGGKIEPTGTAECMRVEPTNDGDDGCSTSNKRNNVLPH